MAKCRKCANLKKKDRPGRRVRRARLPPEVIARITEELCNRDKGSFAGTCHWLHENVKFNSSFNVTLCDQTLNSSKFKAVQYKRVGALHIFNYSSSNLPKSLSFSSLTQLNIGDGVQQQIISKLLNATSLLQTLIFTSFRTNTSRYFDGVFEESALFRRSFAKLKTLTIFENVLLDGDATDEDMKSRDENWEKFFQLSFPLLHSLTIQIGSLSSHPLGVSIRILNWIGQQRELHKLQIQEHIPHIPTQNPITYTELDNETRRCFEKLRLSSLLIYITLENWKVYSKILASQKYLNELQLCGHERDDGLSCQLLKPLLQTSLHTLTVLSLQLQLEENGVTGETFPIDMKLFEKLSLLKVLMLKNRRPVFGRANQILPRSELINLQLLCSRIKALYLIGFEVIDAEIIALTNGNELLELISIEKHSFEYPVSPQVLNCVLSMPKLKELTLQPISHAEHEDYDDRSLSVLRLCSIDSEPELLRIYVKISLSSHPTVNTYGEINLSNYMTVN